MKTEYAAIQIAQLLGYKKYLVGTLYPAFIIFMNNSRQQTHNTLLFSLQQQLYKVD